MNENEELQERMNEATISLLDWAQSAGAFVTEQAPLVAQEYIEWRFWENVIWAFIALLIVVVAIKVGPALVRRRTTAYLRASARYAEAKKTDHYVSRTDFKPWSEDHEVIWISMSIVILIAAIVVCVGTTKAIKTQVAPRVVVVDWLRAQVR